MKHIFKFMIAGAMLLLGATALQAQPGGQGFGGGQMPDAAQMAKMRADQMKDVVKLTDDQYNKIVEMYKAESEEMMKRMQGGAPQMGGGDMEAMRKDMEKRREEQNKKLQAILTADQYKKWEEYMQNMMRQFGGGPGGPGPR